MINNTELDYDVRIDKIFVSQACILPGGGGQPGGSAAPPSLPAAGLPRPVLGPRLGGLRGPRGEEEPGVSRLQAVPQPGSSPLLWGSHSRSHSGSSTIIILLLASLLYHLSY